MFMDEIADRLDARPSQGRLPERRPGRFGEAVGFAVAAPEQIHQSLRRQFLHGVLRGGEIDCSSGSPLSLISASVEIRMSPCGATMRLHQLPKPSR